MNTKKYKMTLKTSADLISYNIDVFINQSNSELSYIEKDKDKTFVNYDYLNNVLKRDNNSLCMEYDFNNENGFIFIKELNKKIDIDLKVKKLENTSKNIYIEYYINDELYKFELLSDE